MAEPKVAIAPKINIAITMTFEVLPLSAPPVGGSPAGVLVPEEEGLVGDPDRTGVFVPCGVAVQAGHGDGVTVAVGVGVQPTQSVGVIVVVVVVGVIVTV